MSTFNELIDFTRSTTGTYLDSVVYGDEVAPALDFNVGNNWNNGGSPTAITYNSFSTVGSGAGYFANAFEVGKTYLVVVDYVGAGLQIRNGTTGGSPLVSNSSSSGTMISTFIPSNPYMYLRATNGAVYTIDNISVKELTGGQVSGTPLLRTAAINEPRLEYDASGNPLGLLIEEARTNAKQYSEVFTTGWSISATTVTSNSTDTTAPDSTNNATKLQVSSFIHETRCRSTASFAQNVDYAFSVFAKAGTSSWLKLRNIGVGDGSSETDTVWFNLSTGSVGTATSNLTPKIESVGNGWYRCSISGTVINTALSLIDVSVVSGNGFVINNTVGDNIYIYGAQLETGAFPTSYIPTSGSTVTRAADIASLPVERFAYNQAQGSVVVAASSFANLSGSDNGYVAVLSDGTSNNRIQVLLRDSSQGFITGGLGGLDAGSVAQSQTTKLAMTVKTNDAGLSLNGGAVVTATSGNIPSPITDLRLGGRTSLNSATLCGHIKQIQYYPKRLSNTELQLLTQPSASPTMNLTFDGQATSTLVEGLHD